MLRITRRSVGDDLAFADVLCAEPDWLRTEFEAIVAASVPPRRAHGAPPTPSRPPSSPEWQTTPAGLPSNTPWPRERSPPISPRRG